jgi:hypothetical protein
LTNEESDHIYTVQVGVSTFSARLYILPWRDLLGPLAASFWPESFAVSCVKRGVKNDEVLISSLLIRTSQYIGLFVFSFFSFFFKKTDV